MYWANNFNLVKMDYSYWVRCCLIKIVTPISVGFVNPHSVFTTHTINGKAHYKYNNNNRKNTKQQTRPQINERVLCDWRWCLFGQLNIYFIYICICDASSRMSPNIYNIYVSWPQALALTRWGRWALCVIGLYCTLPFPHSPVDRTRNDGSPWVIEALRSISSVFVRRNKRDVDGVVYDARMRLLRGVVKCFYNVLCVQTRFASAWSARITWRYLQTLML